MKLLRLQMLQQLLLHRYSPTTGSSVQKTQKDRMQNSWEALSCPFLQNINYAAETQCTWQEGAHACFSEYSDVRRCMLPMQDVEAQVEGDLPMMDDDDLYQDLYSEDYEGFRESALQGTSSAAGNKEEELPLSTPLLKSRISNTS